MRRFILALVFVATPLWAQPQFSDETATRMPVGTVDRSEATALVDVDGDGDLDYVIGGLKSPAQTRLLLNDGSGAFTEVTATSMPIDSDLTYGIAAGDVDGDGDFDIVLANFQQQNRLYLNAGNGVFSDGTIGRLPIDSDFSTEVKLADFDADGDLDLVVGNAVFTRDRLYLNDGGGVFTEAAASRFPVDADVTQAIAVGDVDADGDLDLVFANGAIQQNRLYLNSGSASFQDATATHLPQSAESSQGVALGDVDGDFDLDLYFANGNQTQLSQDRLWLNDGSGSFVDVTATQLPIETDNDTSVVVTDIDEDGDNDLLIGCWIFGQRGSGHNRCYVNDGLGNFTDDTYARLPSQVSITASLVVGDLDGDGDQDFLCGNGRSGNPVASAQNRIYINHRREPGAAPSVLINEISTGSADFIEIYNASGGPLDLHGWTIYTYENAGASCRRPTGSMGLVAQYTFPRAGQVMLAPNAFLEVRENGVAGRMPTITAVETGSNMAFHDRSELEVWIESPLGIVADYVAIGDVAVERQTASMDQWRDAPVIRPRSGADLVLRRNSPTIVDSDSAADWLVRAASGANTSRGLANPITTAAFVGFGEGYSETGTCGPASDSNFATRTPTLTIEDYTRSGAGPGGSLTFGIASGIPGGPATEALLVGVSGARPGIPIPVGACAPLVDLLVAPPLLASVSGLGLAYASDGSATMPTLTLGNSSVFASGSLYFQVVMVDANQSACPIRATQGLEVNFSPASHQVVPRLLADYLPMNAGDSYDFALGGALAGRISFASRSGEPNLSQTVLEMTTLDLGSGERSAIYLVRQANGDVLKFGEWFDEPTPPPAGDDYQEVLDVPGIWAPGSFVLFGVEPTRQYSYQGYEPRGATVPVYSGTEDHDVSFHLSLPITTPLGRFSDVVRVRFDSRWNENYGGVVTSGSDTTDVWLARGVGPVRYQQDAPFGTIVELMSGTVAGAPIIPD